jgi:hypothetical protein
MKNLILWSILFSLFSAFMGCDANPVNRLVNPSPSNISGVWSGAWVIYDDEVKTGGAIMTYNTGATLDFHSTDNPHSGKDCIRYSWDGSPVLTYASLPAHPTDYIQSGYSGFSLICAPTDAQYFTATRNLSLGGYTKITFWARGELFTNVNLRVEANSNDQNQYKYASGYPGVWQGTVTSGWQQYSVKLDTTTTNLNNLAAATDFIKIILLYTPGPDDPPRGNGGTVFLDDIELTK